MGEDRSALAKEVWINTSVSTYRIGRLVVVPDRLGWCAMCYADI